MEVKEIIAKLEEKDEFRAWKKVNYVSSLVHIFKMFDEANKDECQIGYYNKDDTITTFILCGDDVKIVPENEIFKKPDDKIRKLSVEDVNIELEEAIKKAREFQKKEYPKDIPTKEMMILQHLDIGQVYNITFITNAFKALNIKIDAKTGEVLHHELISLMDLKQK